MIRRTKTRTLARTLALLLALAVLPVPRASAAATPAAGLPAPAGVTVTLVTGDKVTVRSGPGGRPTVSVAPAERPGRRVSFQTTYAGEEVRVVPSDVAHLVPTVLDPQLFEVTALARSGYHDGATDALPLIVRQAPGPAAVAGGMRTVRQLPSIGAAAVELPTSAAATAAAALASTGGTFAGMTRVWLDAPVHSDHLAAGTAQRLDRNLDQIGAPTAWAAGLSGAGVRVAVLDTGVDADHPDLAGRVVAAANFTPSPHTGDRNGHGTHVASLVVGTGAAADGARRGVAFGAQLLSGKVLDDRGVGQFSDIIAGMEWAAAQGAQVVNLSLGSDTPSTGRDPLSLSVDALSAAHGVLFVASAGNRGPGATTVGAPGAADSALTVGAVDRHDRLADFSSRGPRLGDHAIKPDLAAPGVDIVAARAAGTALGDPVDARYTRLSGTSMAAPQVAGAAALLTEQHPLWTAETIKAALVGTATPLAAGAFDAGSGRVSLAGAIGQRVVAARPALGFGFVGYPQAGLPPVQRELDLVNSGDAAVTVDLAAQLSTPDGHPAPTGMLTVTPARLTVPAGGRAAATATIAVDLGGSGAFAGALTATRSDGPAVRVPVGVVKESTRHLLHIRAVDRNGTSRVETLATVVNLGDVTASPPDPVLLTNGQATVRVAPGFYTVTAAVPTLEEGEPVPDSIGTADLVVTSVAVATVAEVEVDGDREVLLDARAARPLSAAVAGAATFPVDVQLSVAVADRAGNGFVLGYFASAQDVIEGRLFVQPTTPARHGRLELASKWRLDTVGGGPTYDLLFAGPAFPSTLEYVADPARLARVHTTYRAPAGPAGYRELRQVFTELNPVSVAVPQVVPQPAPLRRTEFLSAGPDRLWFQCATLTVADAGIGDYCQPPADYRLGSAVGHEWLSAPLRTTAVAFRTDTGLLIGANDLAEAGPNGGSIAGHAFAHRSYALYRDGSLLAEGTDPLGVHAVPPGSATFRLTRTVEVRPDLLALSTLVRTDWTFVSDPPRPGRPAAAAPLLDVAMRVPLDEHNRAPAGVALDLELLVRHPAGPVATVALELSTDDGRTWQAVDLRRIGDGRYLASVVPAAGAVSLRTAATDTAANHTEQTILRAFVAGSPQT